MKFKKLLCILFVLAVFVSHAQYTNLKFENFDTTQGLSSSTCVEIFQDSEGFLWFGTIDGLNKYNGYEFEVYRPVLNDPASISNNRINAITEDSKGRLWIGTSNGLNVFDKKTEKFYKVNLYRKQTDGENFREIINGLLYDKNTDNLWIASRNGLIKLSLNNAVTGAYDKLSFTHYTANGSNRLDNNNVTNIVQDKNRTIWVGTNGANLHRYDPKSNSFSKISIEVTPGQFLDHLPKQILIDHEGDFWIGNDLSKLYIFNAKTGKYKNVSPVSKSTPVFHLYRDKMGTVWAATDGDGVYLIDKNKGLLQHLTQNPNDPFSLPNNQPSKVLEDRGGIFWIATYNKGISKLALSKSLFGHYFYTPNAKNGLSTRIAQSVLQDSNNRIWIGTDGGGLNLFNQKNNTYTHYRTKPGDASSLSSDKILYLLNGENDVIWVCTWDGGLNKFNTATGTAIRYEYNPKDIFSLGQNTVWCAAKDAAGRLWLGTSTAGLNLFDPVTQKFYRYKNIPGDTHSLINNFVFSVFIDSKNRLFAGTAQGLCYMQMNKKEQGIPKKLHFTGVNIKNIRGNRINYITEDHNGNIWLGTDMGLYELDKNLHLKNSYSSLNGLPNNLVVGIQQDDNKNFWITTKSGLSLLNYKTRAFENFNVHDGLQGTEFQSKSITKINDGRIIAGGINGFNIFNPNNISLKHKTIKPVITNLKLYNKPVKAGDTINGRVLLNQSVTTTPHVKLKYNEGYVSLDFVALNYENPERVKYAYKMAGLDDNYIIAGNNRVANYSNLVPGDYVFEVLAAADGDWDKAGKANMHITVLSPPWKTWWAYTIYALVFISALWFSVYYYTKKMREEKEHELDQMKLKFFINVSHEFRTPLTLILNPVDKILSSYNDPEAVKNSAQIIQRSSRRLLYLVNQLLDLRKMDLGKTPLDITRINMVKFCKDIFVLFEDLAKAKEIRFVFDSSVKEFHGMFDPDKVEKILTNLLSNAIKFTDRGGKVTLSINEVNQYVWVKKWGVFKKIVPVRAIEITIADTGIGLKKEQMGEIFQRFFHADSSKTGTGIGLNFTKGLVELHKGEIFVESEYGKGTTFTVRLPANLKASKKAAVNFSEHGTYDMDLNSIKSAEYEIAISNEDNADDATQPQLKGSRPVVLIVEDNKELRNHLKNELSGQFQVKEAANGQIGLEKIKKYFPDIVISDVMMPEMDGFEMCRQVKNELETSHIPVILLTARSLEEDRIEGYDTGADEYLPKPFNINVLKARIKNLLESRRRSRERFASIGGVVATGDIATNSLDEMFLDKTTKIVMANIANLDFTLDDVIKELSLGRSQFYRKITSITGQNPSNFIRTIRLKYASELLLQKRYSIKEITHMCGFNSSAYFTKTFKELYGVTPTQFGATVEQKISE